MSGAFPEGIPWRRFREFISPEADRFAILDELFAEAGLEHRALEIDGKRHILVTPGEVPGRADLSPGRRARVILTAHYDRARGSPGANDNSAGVFLLFETAVKLKQAGLRGWLVIFTDKEELEPGESIQAQGSYQLGLRLKNLKPKNPKIFCFDACGAGDTLVISTTADYLLKGETGGEKLRESILELRKLALDTARDLGMPKVLLAPTPFSDDAGFLRAGVAAQTVTMLPSAEGSRLVSELRKNPEYAETLINAESRQGVRARSIPETWRSLNTPGDSHIRLTPGHFKTVTRFAGALCKS